MLIIGILAIGIFSIFQDIYEENPVGIPSFTPHFSIGIVLVTGSIIVFVILSINRKRISKPKP
jgi:hypothetical protein